jgi:hypothetical protein
MQLDLVIGSFRLAAVAALLCLSGCAAASGGATPEGTAATPAMVDARSAGLRGPIEARGPATAGEAEEIKAESVAAAPPPVRFLDRERDRWYFYDEQRQIYRWDNGDAKR